jgi:hypothetical protein
MMAQPQVKVEGLKETLRAFSKLDKEVQKAARDEVQKVANLLAREIASAGRSQSDRRSQFVAGTVRGTRERTPVIKVGKASRMPVTRRGAGPRASDLMYGMEFGSAGTGGKSTDLPTRRGGRPGWRFPERTARKGRSGNVGTWIYPTAARQQSRVVSLWTAALDKAAKEWGS